MAGSRGYLRTTPFAARADAPLLPFPCLNYPQRTNFGNLFKDRVVSGNILFAMKLLYLFEDKSIFMAIILGYWLLVRVGFLFYRDYFLHEQYD